MRKSRTFLVMLTLLVGIGVGAVGLMFVPRPTRAPSTSTTTSTSVAPSTTTTTTDPYANLRASVEDYCTTQGRGHAVIVVKNGAPDARCTD